MTESREHPSACPHDPITEIGEDVFMVRGSIRLNPVMRISRNMAIVRHGGELTLINPIRLDDRGESELRALGEVKHLIRLGAFHGQDDPYYTDRWEATFWCQEGGNAYPAPLPDRVLDESSGLPFPDGELFCFRQTKQPEAAIVVKRGEGLLLTCDSVQHYGDYSHINLPARVVMRLLGFRRTTLIGPIWLKLMTPENGALAEDFRRLLELEFDALLSAHGTFLPKGAHRAVANAVAAVRDKLR